VTGPLRHAARASAPASALAVLAGLGWPAAAAFAGLAVLALAAACWVIGSRERSDRVSRILLARRGDARGLYPLTPTNTRPGQPQRQAPPPPRNGHA
jgi:hypothetical protein